MAVRWMAAVLSTLLVASSVAACDALRTSPSGVQEPCVQARLDQVADVTTLFADPSVGCVIVVWDTEMRGAGLLADGGVGTPAGLADAARDRGFTAPCETTVSAKQPSVDRGWFITRFGALDPGAAFWGVTLFLRDPLPDGVQPGCVNVTPLRR